MESHIIHVVRVYLTPDELLVMYEQACHKSDTAKIGDDLAFHVHNTANLQIRFVLDQNGTKE